MARAREVGGHRYRRFALRPAAGLAVTLATLLGSSVTQAATHGEWNATTRQLGVSIQAAPSRNDLEIPCRNADSAGQFTVLSPASWSVAGIVKRGGLPFLRLARSAPASVDETVVVQISGTDARGGLGTLSLTTDASLVESTNAEQTFLASRDFNESSLTPTPDFSGTATSPTPLSFDSGSNRISGAVRVTTDTQDYIRFTVPSGTQLTALYVMSFDPNNTCFNAITQGPVSFDPNTGSVPAGVLYGGNHVGLEADKTDISARFAPGAVPAGAGPGINFPLGPGTYSYEVQQTSAILSSYTLDFTITEVVTVSAPMPAWSALATAGALVMLGLGLARRAPRRRVSS